MDAAPNVGVGACFNTSVTTIAMQRDGRGVLERYANISHLLAPVVATNADEIPEETAKDANTNKIEDRNKDRVQQQ